MKKRPQAPLRVLTGPTAAGKKEIAFALARRWPLGIVAMDSVKVYRGLRVGAAAPSEADIEGVEVHLVGIADPTRPYSVGDWVRDARNAVRAIEARGLDVLFVGGTPLYLRALLRGLFEGPGRDEQTRRRLEREAQSSGGPAALHARLARADPEAAARIHPHDIKRIVRALEVVERTGLPISQLWRQRTRLPFERPLRVAGIDWPEDQLERRQRERVEAMYRSGLVEEVRRLEEAGQLCGEARRAIGYREAIRVLRGEWTIERAMEETVRATRTLTRKQRKWFRQFPEIRWHRREEGEDPARLLTRLAESLGLSAEDSPTSRGGA